MVVWFTDRNGSIEDQVTSRNVYRTRIHSKIENASGIRNDGSFCCTGVQLTKRNISNDCLIANISIIALRQGAICHRNNTISLDVYGFKFGRCKDIPISILNNIIFRDDADIAACTGHRRIQGNRYIIELNGLLSGKQNIASHTDSRIYYDWSVRRLKHKVAATGQTCLIKRSICCGSRTVDTVHCHTQVSDCNCTKFSNERRAIGRFCAEVVNTDFKIVRCLADCLACLKYQTIGCDVNCIVICKIQDVSISCNNAHSTCRAASSS